MSIILKRTLGRLLPPRVVRALAGLKLALAGENLQLNRRLTQSQHHQRLLARRLLAQYEHLHAGPPAAASKLRDQELSVYSQNGEDGILLHLFAAIDVHSHRFVEFGVGDGEQCNTANLAIHFGWQGLLIEGDSALAARATRFYGSSPDLASRVRVRNEWVTAENIDRILQEEKVVGEIDLLSIDIDGNDYWVWQAVSAIAPRVVVIEYNASLGAERRIAVPYVATAAHRTLHRSGFYHGASLAALASLAAAKGYRLVGCESAGVNAFFVREDLVAAEMAELTPGEAFYPHAARSRNYSQEEQWRIIAAMPFVTVE